MSNQPLVILSSFQYGQYDIWREMVRDYDADITADRACNSWEKSFCNNTDITLMMIQVDHEPAGFLHYNFHEFVFAIGKTCYLSDLYVIPKFRRRGIARCVLSNLILQAQTEGWERLYWVTEHANPARSLYDELAQADFVRYHIDFN